MVSRSLRVQLWGSKNYKATNTTVITCEKLGSCVIFLYLWSLTTFCLCSVMHPVLGGSHHQKPNSIAVFAVLREPLRCWCTQDYLVSPSWKGKAEVSACSPVQQDRNYPKEIVELSVWDVVNSWHLCLNSQQGCPSLPIIIMIFMTNYVHLSVCFLASPVLLLFSSTLPPEQGAWHTEAFQPWCDWSCFGSALSPRPNWLNLLSTSWNQLRWRKLKWKKQI